MEIGAEISKNIKGAIKGKLQELGAYIDDELPDYIMVMVANKKTPQQMADDLSLFLGSNTAKFTVWLQGVLDKLRTVAVEPASLRHQHYSDGGSNAGKITVCINDGLKSEESKVLLVSSSRSERTETRVSSSANSSRRSAAEKSSSRLTSAVKPIMELLPSEAVIDIKPEMDDDLIGEDPLATSGSHSRARRTSSRPTAEIYRPGQSRMSSAGHHSTAEGSAYSRHHDGRTGRSSTAGSSREELSRKRKAPVVSSVVRVNRSSDEDSDDGEEEDAEYGGRGLSSRVSLAAKPERKPTLPPAKQANRNLILKAISEAQDSITKTTAFPSMPQRQTVPVAPRARLASSEEMSAAIQLVQEHLHSLEPRVRAYPPTGLPPSGAPAPVRSLASRLQLSLAEGGDGSQQRHNYGVKVVEGGKTKTSDTRSFIMSQQQEPQPREQPREGVQPAIPRTVQASVSKDRGDSASPKFIVTLDGVPSPLGNFADSEMEPDDVRPPTKMTEAPAHLSREPKVSVLHRLQGRLAAEEDDAMDFEMEEMEEEEGAVPLKRQKAMERCKFWPVCKSGDECLYHHPTTQCKTFPSCKFGDKCLFVHPNCKYDARCTKPDCPFTHVSRRSTGAPPPRPAAQPISAKSTCRFFPDCKNLECPFYHPKPCRFAAQCKRPGCTFYHPTTSVPPRHALKWTKAQSS